MSPPTDPSGLRYAGIGARSTPAAVLAQMATIARWLERQGWHLATGGASGADAAFADAASPGARTLYLPWAGYNGRAGADAAVPSPAQLAAWAACARAHHPAWERCSPAVRKLHARNAAILLGPDLDRPVDAAVAWTPGGRAAGGTGLGIRIARSAAIPVLNLATVAPRAACERLRDLRRARLSGPAADGARPGAGC